MIQRGLPSLPSKFLQKRIGLTYKGKKFRNGYPLIDPQGSPEWYKTIKGATDSIDNPARYFYETLLPKHLKKIANKGCRDYGFICQLLFPETPINQITKAPPSTDEGPHRGRSSKPKGAACRFSLAYYLSGQPGELTSDPSGLGQTVRVHCSSSSSSSPQSRPARPDSLAALCSASV